MCFFKNNNQLEHQVSSEDVYVYKIFSKDWKDSSVLHPVMYRTSMCYKVGDEVVPKDNISVDYLDKELVLTNGVIHSYNKEKINKMCAGKQLDNYVAVVKCTIPAGTPYWTNSFGEITSTKIIIQEVIH